MSKGIALKTSNNIYNIFSPFIKNISGIKMLLYLNVLFFFFIKGNTIVMFFKGINIFVVMLHFSLLYSNSNLKSESIEESFVKISQNMSC